MPSPDTQKVFAVLHAKDQTHKKEIQPIQSAIREDLKAFKEKGMTQTTLSGVMSARAKLAYLHETYGEMPSMKKFIESTTNDMNRIFRAFASGYESGTEAEGRRGLHRSQSMAPERPSSRRSSLRPSVSAPTPSLAPAKKQSTKKA